MITKFVSIQAPDGTYDIPLIDVAEDRALHYAYKEDFKRNSLTWQDEINFVFENNYEAIDWMLNNTDWEDWLDVAIKIDNKETGIQPNEFWTTPDHFHIIDRKTIDKNLIDRIKRSGINEEENESNENIKMDLNEIIETKTKNFNSKIEKQENKKITNEIEIGDLVRYQPGISPEWVGYIMDIIHESEYTRKHGYTGDVYFVKDPFGTAIIATKKENLIKGNVKVKLN